MCPCKRVRGGFCLLAGIHFQGSQSVTVSTLITQTSIFRCLFVWLPRRILLFDINPQQTASAAGMKQTYLRKKTHENIFICGVFNALNLRTGR